MNLESGTPLTQQKFRLVVMGPQDVAQYLRTGYYNYDIEIKATYSTDVYTRTLIGDSELINLVDDEIGETHLGKRWWLDVLDRLVPSDGISPSISAPPNKPNTSNIYYQASSTLGEQGLMVENGAALIRGDGTTAWYEASFNLEDYDSAPQFNTSDVTEIHPFDVTAIKAPNLSNFNITKYTGTIPNDPYYSGTSYNVTIGANPLAFVRQREFELETWFATSGLRNEEVNHTWTFNSNKDDTGILDNDRMYQIFVSWSPSEFAATAVPYTIITGKAVGVGAVDDKRIIVNQQYTPGDSYNKNDASGNVYSTSDRRWRSLGYFMPEGGKIEVEISSVLYPDEILASDKFVNGEMSFGDVVLVDHWTYQTPEGSFDQLIHGAITAQDEASLAYHVNFLNTGDRPGDGDFTLISKHASRFDFTNQGLLDKIVDRNNNQTVFTYDDVYINGSGNGFAGEIKTITTQGGLVTLYDYNTSGYLEKITDFAGRTTDIVINAGLLNKFTENFGLIPNSYGSVEPELSFTYQAGTDLLLTATEKVDAINLNTTTIEYHPDDHRVTQVNNADSTLVLRYSLILG